MKPHYHSIIINLDFDRYLCIIGELGLFASGNVFHDWHGTDDGLRLTRSLPFKSLWLGAGSAMIMTIKQE